MQGIAGLLSSHFVDGTATERNETKIDSSPADDCTYEQTERQEAEVPDAVPSCPTRISLSPLMADLLVCWFCKQVTKKGEPLPGSKADGQGKAQ
jgi:hypothetical protein